MSCETKTFEGDSRYLIRQLKRRDIGFYWFKKMWLHHGNAHACCLNVIECTVK